MIRAISTMYGQAALWRRRWYASAGRRRRLARPVVSVGNLRVGGSGKTPAVACIARILLTAGERPAILTRGYARRSPSAGTTVVADGHGIVATADAAGDEPMLLARLLPGVPVLVGADRFLSGRLAEERFGATVHILDDGFQHHELAREVDLLLVSEDDLADAPLPGGRLREPLGAAAAADAVLVPAGYATAAERVARALGVHSAFRVTRALGVPRMVAGDRDTVVVPAGSRVYIAAGIARPERFVADVISAGWDVVGTSIFRDHYQFTNADVRRIATAALAARAAIVLTTEKDAVRLESCDLGDVPLASVPLLTTIEPADAFRDWLVERLRSRRRQDDAPQVAATALHRE